jgi:hypothetical protein
LFADGIAVDDRRGACGPGHDRDSAHRPGSYARAGVQAGRKTNLGRLEKLDWADLCNREQRRTAASRGHPLRTCKVVELAPTNWNFL